MSVRETVIQRRIREALNAMPGVRVFRNNVGLGRTLRGTKIRFGLSAGSADLVGIVDGRFFAIEVKTPVGKLSPKQKLWAAAIRRLGGFIDTGRSVDAAKACVVACRAGRNQL